MFYVSFLVGASVAIHVGSPGGVIEQEQVDAPIVSLLPCWNLSPTNFVVFTQVILYTRFTGFVIRLERISCRPL